jgi:hypothetical protein
MGTTEALPRALFAHHGFAMEALVAVRPQSEHLNSIYSHRMQLMRIRTNATRSRASRSPASDLGGSRTTR